MIELIVVIVIIGILAVIGIPAYTNLQQQAKVSATRGNLGAIRAALKVRAVSNAAANAVSVWPTTIDAAMFVDAQIPLNPITNSRAVNYVGAALSVADSAVGGAGWWYVNTGADLGHAGAYTTTAAEATTINS